MIMNLTHKDVDGILKIIDEAKNLDEIEFVLGEIRLRVVRNGSDNGDVPRIDRSLSTGEGRHSH